MRILAFVAALLVALASPVAAQTLQEHLEFAAAHIAAAKALAGPPIIVVGASEDPQTAVDTAAPGSIVQFAAGAVYGSITVRRSLTLQGTARFVATGSFAMKIEAGDVVVDGLELTGNANDLLWIAQTAGHVTLRQVYIHGDPTYGAKRGIQANGAGGLTMEDSVITDIFRAGQESAGIGAWDSPGPFVIRRSLVQAASINFLFGGADPSSEAHIPADILIEDSTFSKKLEWRAQNYAAKNLGEIKNAKRVIIRRNTFQTSWVQGQAAYGLVLAVRNQDGGCPYCTVEHVLVEDNTIKDVGTAVSILGRDSSQPSRTMRNITFRNNIFDNVNRAQWGGRGATFEILRGPESLTIVGQRVINSPLTDVHSALFFGQGAFPATGLVVRDSQFVEGQYGLIGDGTLNAPLGAPALGAYAPGYVWETNTVQRSYVRTVPWPAGTTVIP